MLSSSPFWARMKADYPFWALILLMLCAFFLGGSSRADTLSVIILRPVAVLCLALGLIGITRDEIRQFWPPLAFMSAVLLLILLHLVPLPPAVWTGLPGRELAARAAELSGIPQPWRPVSLVPWRAWNSLFAMLVPAAAMVLAVRCRPEQRQALILVILALGALSMVLGILQAISGYRESFYLYSVSSDGSPNGLLANRNHQAALLACMFPLLAFFGAKRGKHVPMRTWLAVAAGAAMLLLLMTTGSRAGFALAIISLGLTAWLFDRGRQPRISYHRRVLAIGAGVIGLLSIMAVAILRSRAEAIGRLLQMDASELRFEYWTAVTDIIGQYFPIGSGVGSFVEVYKLHEPHELLNWTYLNHAHNDWLEWTLEAGLPGMILMVTALIFWLMRFVRLVRELPHRGDQTRLAASGGVVLLLLGIASVVDYPLRVPLMACFASIATIWMAAPRLRHAT